MGTDPFAESSVKRKLSQVCNLRRIVTLFGQDWCTCDDLCSVRTVWSSAFCGSSARSQNIAQNAIVFCDMYLQRPISGRAA